MGNINQPATDHGQSKMKGWPITFHEVHSDNIQLSADHRRAKRVETFCKGICFSGRPVLPNEKVFIRFSEVSTSWSGAIRFGFTSHDPASLDRDSLPRYACPDLTNCPGYWAKALPERLARHGSVLLFCVAPSGEVTFGINGEDKGIFFGGITTTVPLWALIDIYGNTVAIEFVDGYQLNNTPVSTNATTTRPHSMVSLDNGMLDWFSSSMSFNVPPQAPSVGLNSSLTFLPIRTVSESLLLPFSFFTSVVGKNICLSSDGSVAVRRVEDYCNAYVFTRRPFRPGETLVVQVLSVDLAYTGGLAFGMTCCDPSSLIADDLPDDSDLFLDRPEYWIVNKDVCANASVADELAFYLTDEGEVHYSRNGRYLSTLMHIDKTLPMWAFFDVYGSVQKIKMLGVIDGPPPWERRLQQPDLTISLPPVLSQQDRSSTTPPPRPPPPRSSPTAATALSSRALPSLPPKLHKSSGMRSSLDLPARDVPTNFIQSPFFVAATAFPSPPTQPVASLSSHHHHHHHHHQRTGTVVSQSLPHPRSRGSKEGRNSCLMPARPQTDSAAERSELADNASNECSVCLEKPSDCVLYTCGHMCMCYECATSVQQTAGASCPICRQPIRDVIKIFRA